MPDVWVLGAYTEGSDTPSRGAWICPEVGAYGVTKGAKAKDKNDAIRCGSAMAILSALNCLGGEMTVHIPRNPSPRWVVNPKHAVPLPNLMYRLIYRMEVHPRIRSGKVSISYTDGYEFREILEHYLKGGKSYVHTEP